MVRDKDEIMSSIRGWCEKISAIKESENKSSEFNADLKMFKELFQHFAEGVEKEDLSVLDLRHALEAFSNICSWRCEDLMKKTDDIDAKWKSIDFPKKYITNSIDELRKQSINSTEEMLDMSKNVTEELINSMDAMMDMTKNVAEEFGYIHLIMSVQSCVMKMGNNEAKNVLEDNPNGFDENAPIDLSEYSTIYDAGGVYAKIEQVGYSKRGIQILEGILGEQPEFDEVRTS